MRQKAFLVILTLVLMNHISLGSAAETPEEAEPVCRFHKWGVTFVVHEMQWIGKASEEESASASDRGLLTAGKSLRMDFEIINDREGRKLDLKDDLQILVQDERGNQFFPLKDAFSKGRVSLYPREGLRRVIHFEPLLEGSRLLKLVLSGIPPQRLQTMSFLLPPGRLQRMAGLGPQNFPEAKDLIVSLTPERNHYLAGQSVRVGLGFPDGVMKPQRVFVMTPNQLLEDDRLNMEYQVNIPSDQLPGVFTVVVMAKWGAQEDGYLVSRSIDLKIADPWGLSAQTKNKSDH